LYIKEGITFKKYLFPTYFFQAMSIYKHVIPRNESVDPTENVTKFNQPESYNLEATDDSYEYFSDKEEAENYRRKNHKNSPKRM
jgi:ABC-type transport system substrate-binding protein